MLTRRLIMVATALLPAAAVAQPWAPSRPVRLVVPFPAGGATDVVARVLGEHMSGTLGQPVVVENRTGAGGNVGVENVVRSPADGHTLLMGTMGTLTINPHLYRGLAFDPARDLVGIGMAFETVHVLVVHPSVPAATVAELIALAKAEPARLAYGSAGSGSSTHMVAELFRLTAGIELTHVPYRGSAPALNDTVAGTVQLMLDQLPSCIGQVQARRLRALAVTGTARHPLLPEVPTMAEVGLPGAAATSWGAVMAPAGTPAPAIARLNAALNAALADGSVRARLVQAGADPISSSPEAVMERMRAETAVWGRVVREANITVN
ncbi:tripartite tricarboxylate transporter substrate binding protein [Elioraea sp. Yellowstone]|jgi:tripartite-type tricarboxylate transporter receptor subunit TctC|uniref:Bug family tripartite tricarboxylate transporter substrate binding protein n=1 Tax=Elioraea sp. Yellowstone TaxID=2592070 RepID=UPI00115236B3|nr:tripartite tricarboxylate transporter substrate binding protein [Elioraea sp. Yellowstone]TQF78965.1 tripartite tricarboxylate transporter substrate binding protein [Elioraea sp. Yellowstone]